MLAQKKGSPWPNSRPDQRLWWQLVEVIPNLLLHPVSRGSRSLYWVDQYPLYLMHEDMGWHVYTPVSCRPVKDWLSELGLLSQFFSTRRDALSVLGLALSQPEAPPEDPLPSLKRLSSGYMLDDRFQIKRSGGVWTVTDRRGNLTSMVSGTLWQASWVALYHKLRMEWAASLPRVKPVTGYTLSEISRQRMVMEGADRPSWANNMLGLETP